ncbi:hypothetical protein [Brevibacillus brevis]|uniref:hypothetical protein n=1 Tax=Brevibacillus brevis TaxID=1393 RepID=UPI00165D56C8|nr:hypothetical protein [Brevibacillus brevis]
MSKFDGHYGFQRMFQEGKMTLGFHIPLEAYEWEAATSRGRRQSFVLRPVP